MNKVASLITSFFTVYLMNERGLSTNTIKSYRDTFVLYFRFLERKKNIKFNKIDISIFSYENILNFLDYLEADLQCCKSQYKNVGLGQYKNVGFPTLLYCLF